MHVTDTVQAPGSSRTSRFTSPAFKFGLEFGSLGFSRGPLGHHSSPRRSAAGAAAAKSGVVPRAPSPECGGDDADDSASGLVIGLCIRGRRQPAASGGRSLAVTPELKVACDCRRGRVSRRAGRRWRSGPLADAGQGGQRHGVRCTVRRAVGEPLRMAPLTGADVPLQRRSAWLGPCQQRPCRQRLQSRRLSAARPSPTSRSSGGYARTHTHARARAPLTNVLAQVCCLDGSARLQTRSSPVTGCASCGERAASQSTIPRVQTVARIQMAYTTTGPWSPSSSPSPLTRSLSP